jgi:DNA polymerase-3 subunit alpha
MLVSQFDNSVAEDAGLLKMDFLGLKTLTIIKNAVRMVKENHGIEIDPEEVPLDDSKTYELFQKGLTMGIFQYESEGMQKHMKSLKPTTFEDLIAMNALYRPGPLEYIPSFIERKHGREKITYDLPACEEYLKETYGITVYQEQVMLLSQKLANFSKGQADMLRKGMGKKKKKLIDMLYPKFISGGESNGHPKKVLDKIWKDWEAFASYAFNKSHSTCYAFVAFQTAYLKANYPAEFMAAVLTNSKSDIKTLTKYLRECKKMSIPVLGPDVNESQSDFSPNKEGKIRFGLSALKGVGEGPVEEIINERKASGAFESIFDFARRLNLRTVNKKAMESLALGGAFDNLDKIDRSRYFAPSDKYDSFLSHTLKYGNAYQTQKTTMANSLFGASEDVMIKEPPIPTCNEWTLIEKLEKEKEVAGIYISGHPLDDYKMELRNFTTCTFGDMERFKGQKVSVGGIVTAEKHGVSQKGTGWGRFTVADYNDSLEIMLFNEDYLKFKDYLRQGEVVFIKGQYKQRWGRDEFSLTVNEVRQLATVGEELTESITVKIPLELLTDNLVKGLANLCETHKGQHDLRFILIDRVNKQKLKLRAPLRKVLADSRLLDKLEKMGLEAKLNG